MKAIIRNIIHLAVFSGLLLTVTPGVSQAFENSKSLDSTENIEQNDSMKSKKDATTYNQASYLRGLQSAERSEVESAIFDVLVLKLQHPGLEVEELHNELKSLAMNSSSRSVRYKAYIAVNFLSDAQWVENHKDEIKVLTENDKYEFFQILADQFRQGYLTTADEVEQ